MEEENGTGCKDVVCPRGAVILIMSFQEKEFDPARFNNRGGQLLRDQQEKIRVEHELKKVSRIRRAPISCVIA